MKILKSVLENIRQRLFDRRIEREIEFDIFPNLLGDKHGEYPFGASEEKLEECAKFGGFDLQLNLEIIERQCNGLPDTYAQAFRFLMHRDLNARLKMYEDFVWRRLPRRKSEIATQTQLVS